MIRPNGLPQAGLLGKQSSLDIDVEQGNFGLLRKRDLSLSMYI